MDKPISVIEVASYSRRAAELLTADERDAVVTLIAYDPMAGDVIPGSGGLRKLRIERDGIASAAADGSFIITTTTPLLFFCLLFTRRMTCRI